jgi:hypothetical protein
MGTVYSITVLVSGLAFSHGQQLCTSCTLHSQILIVFVSHKKKTRHSRFVWSRETIQRKYIAQYWYFLTKDDKFFPSSVFLTLFLFDYFYTDRRKPVNISLAYSGSDY